MMNFKEFLLSIGIRKNQNILIHSSFKKILFAFPDITPAQVIDILKEVISSEGSIVFPTFTYCFKKSKGEFEVFDSNNSKSKVGILSDVFRLSDDVFQSIYFYYNFTKCIS